jgi:hypothetical protein
LSDMGLWDMGLPPTGSEQAVLRTRQSGRKAAGERWIACRSSWS